MSKFNPEYYETLLHGLKFVNVSVIEQKEPKETNRKLRYSVLPLRHEQPTIMPITLEVESSVLNRRSFGFKLFERNFMPSPFFRYEAYGNAHRNHFDHIPLAEQQVPTPHFHGYTTTGRSFAYQSDFLKELIRIGSYHDINSSFNCFCHESNIYGESGQLPEIKEIAADELFMVCPEEDPLENVNFV